MGAEPERENRSNDPIVMPKAAVYIAAVSVCFIRHTDLDAAFLVNGGYGLIMTVTVPSKNCRFTLSVAVRRATRS